MKKFESLSKLEVSEIENAISERWQNENIYEKTLDKDKENFVFYDGPAFANGFPGLHHMVAKNLKDSICKYQTMNGKNVLRKIGWDTHGLPIENHVEKKLGFNNKSDIENYGINKFNEECRKSVKLNEDAFVNLTNKMGQFIDTKNPYITMDNNYIETEWWILKEMFNKGYFYKGNKIMPYCPKCGTGLASHEVAQGYQDVTVDTVTVAMKLKEEENTYLLVWTTTPWTLISNVAVRVNPDEEYVKVKVNENYFILASKLAKKVLGDDIEVVKNYKGKDLEYKEYEQLVPSLTPDKKAFFVTCDTYVTMEDGTGIVHIAPAFGEDDKNVGEKYNLPVLNPVGEDGCYKEGPWKGMLVFDADLEVIKYLKENDKLFKKQKMSHNYPHCWRCGTPLIYYAMPAYYVAVSKFKDKLVKANSEINWYPNFIGEKRFGNWLENARDWNVSRSRYWGAPIPLWECSCGHSEMIGSREELKEKSINKLDDSIDLHKPYIDEVYIKCEKCGKKMTRIPEVLDCWFDSGSMPFAQYHYPFENKELFDNQFPADFICEGIDQTRGWFYTLLVISTFVKGVSPFKNVLVNDLLLDANGKKMSKSKGNIVEPFTTIKEYGADTVRFYLLYTSPVWTPLKFDMNGLKEVYSKFFNPLRNTYSFFSLYANTDNIDIDKCFVDIMNREEIDKWIISKYNTLVKYVNESFEEFDLNKVVKAFAEFVSEDLSNWYIRRNRNRFWKSELDNSKKSVYITTYEILCGLSKLIAPITPFLAEDLYTKLTGEDTVHTKNYPKADESLIDEILEQKMSLVRDLISVGRKVREENKVKVRQPINKAMIDEVNKSKLEDLTSLIKEELNVKEVVFVNDLNKYMVKEIKPNFKNVGKVFGPKVNEFKNFLENLTEEQKENIINLEFCNIKINESMIEIRVSEKEGLSVGTINNEFIILDLNLTEELINEGLARELVSKIQNMRKELDFNVSDRIIVKYNAADEFVDSIKGFLEYIKNETLASVVEIDKNIELDNKVNEYDIGIVLEKLK